MAPIIAGVKPWTAKPGTILATKRIKNPLITKVNNPKVRMLMGSVRIKSIGLMKALIIPNASATIKAVKNVFTSKPGTKLETIRMASAESSQLARVATIFLSISQ